MVIVFLLSIVNCQLSIAQSPRVTTHYVDGVRLAAEGSYPEALAEFETALRLEPNHDPSLYGAAGVLGMSMDNKDIARALDYSLRATRLDPLNEWYGRLRQSLLSLVDVRVAKAFYAGDAAQTLELVDLRVSQPETDRMRGNFMRVSALQLAGRLKSARKVVGEMLREATTDSVRSELHGTLGSLWHEEANARKTFAEYDKALRYNRDNALVLNNYAYYLAESGTELDRALGMASRAVKRQEDNPTYLDTYAWVLYKLGDYAEAKAVMQRALPLDTEGSAELLRHYADILSALGEDFMAETYRRRAEKQLDN